MKKEKNKNQEMQEICTQFNILIWSRWRFLSLSFLSFTGGSFVLSIFSSFPWLLHLLLSLVLLLLCDHLFQIGNRNTLKQEAWDHWILQHKTFIHWNLDVHVGQLCDVLICYGAHAPFGKISLCFSHLKLG